MGMGCSVSQGASAREASNASTNTPKSDQPGGDAAGNPASTSSSSQAKVEMHQSSTEIVHVTWLSLDPKEGRIDFYPECVARQLEKAFATGARQGFEVNLGPSFFNALVVGDGRNFKQRTGRGSRDVRRIEIKPDVARVHLLVSRDKDYRIVDASARGAERRMADVPLEVLVAKGGDAADLLTPGFAGNPALEAEDANLAALWEWCGKVDARAVNAHTVPNEEWGVYGEENNKLIEDAQQKQMPYAEITVGIRTYKIIFGPEKNFARQEDTTLRKRRLVRRRLLPVEDYAAAFQAPASAIPEGECAICFADFEDTAALPVLKLPGCGHLFHTACLTQIADTGKPCPLCRSEVDWASVLSRK